MGKQRTSMRYRWSDKHGKNLWIVESPKKTGWKKFYTKSKAQAKRVMNERTRAWKEKQNKKR